MRGRALLIRLRASNSERLVCIPLKGIRLATTQRTKHVSAFRQRVAYRMFLPTRRADWETFWSCSPTFPEEIRIQAGSCPQDPLYSELGAFFSILSWFTTRILFFYSERGYLICQYGIPLLSLYNLISATQLDASPDISFITFLRPEWEQGQPPKWVVEEWNALTEASKHYRSEPGLITGAISAWEKLTSNPWVRDARGLRYWSMNST